MSKFNPMGMLSVPEGSIITPLYGRVIQVVTPAGPIYEVKIVSFNGEPGGVFEQEPGEITIDRLSEVGLELNDHS